MQELFLLLGIIVCFFIFIKGDKINNNIIDNQNRQNALDNYKDLYIDSNYRIRDSKTNCILYRLTIHGKEYYCYNTDIFHPQIHSKISK